jgi:hypothetical protein
MYPVGAKNKLNAAHLNGALVIAALAGWATGSWVIFVLAAVALLAAAVVGGGIRR